MNIMFEYNGILVLVQRTTMTHAWQSWLLLGTFPEFIAANTNYICYCDAFKLGAGGLLLATAQRYLIF